MENTVGVLAKSLQVLSANADMVLSAESSSANSDAKAQGNLTLKELLKNLAKVRRDINVKAAADDNRFDFTDVEKRSAKLRNLKDELEYVKLYSQILRKKKVAGGKNDDLDKAIDSLFNDKSSLLKQIAALESQAGIGGWSGLVDQFESTLTQLDQKWGSWTKQAATTFDSTFTSSMDTLSTGITHMIKGTKEAKYAWHDIGVAISDYVISAIVKMGLQYITTKTLMMAFDTIASRKSRQESAETAAISGAAGLGKSGEQGGWWGLLAYIAIYAAGLALISSLVKNYRASGGPVTAGMPYVVGEKRPELFVPSQSGFILPSVPQAMELNRASSSWFSSSSSMNVHFAGVMDSEALAIKGLSGKRGRKFLLDFQKGSVREITGRG